jgi:hypothetical protein
MCLPVPVTSNERRVAVCDAEPQFRYSWCGCGGQWSIVRCGGNDFSDFVLPLRSNEHAKATVVLNTVQALAFGSKLVYAANLSGESVSTYALPLTNGETPTVTITGLDNPRALAVNTKSLFVLERMP